jgi:hypothetical protein
MAEVLGPLGMCLAGISFILSTVPSAAKAANTYRERQSRILAMELSLATCLSTFISRKEEWRSLHLNGHEDLLSRVIIDIQKLSQTIDDNITKFSNDDERKEWKKAKHKSLNGKFHKARQIEQEFRYSITYTLWGKEFLEGWLTRLEGNIKAIDALHARDQHDRTAEHNNKELTQSTETNKLEGFASKLYTLATNVYNDCTTIPETFAWGVGLQPPHSGCDISRWHIPIPIRVELQFSVVEQFPRRTEHFRLQVVYKEDDDTTCTSKEALDQIDDIVKPQCSAYGRQYSSTKVDKKRTSTIRTPSIAELFGSRPHLFKDDTWLVERLGLIFGISQWSLLLWNTPWLDGFCCHGLVMESDPSSEGSARYIYEEKEHGSCQPRGVNHKLRNLGLVWAQLILCKPIYPATEGDMKKFDMWSKGKREEVDRYDINERVLIKTGSLPLQEAINFCLEPQPRLSEFKSGHLFVYIEKMHNR